MQVKKKKFILHNSCALVDGVEIKINSLTIRLKGNFKTKKIKNLMYITRNCENIIRKYYNEEDGTFDIENALRDVRTNSVMAGKVVKITGNSSGHGFKNGELVTLTGGRTNFYHEAESQTKPWRWWINENDFEIQPED